MIYKELYFASTCAFSAFNILVALRIGTSSAATAGRPTCRPIGPSVAALRFGKAVQMHYHGCHALPVALPVFLLLARYVPNVAKRSI